jgi:hypothetical protein
MINYLNQFKYGSALKWLMSILLLSALLLSPEYFFHLIAVVLHTFYESLAFAIEEVLVHGFGLSKFQAQMIVFYTSLTSGLLLLIVLIRRIPHAIAVTKSRVSKSYNKACADLIIIWVSLLARRKFELMVMQFAGFISMMIFVLA